MPLQLPTLDDRRYPDLVEEALSLIPAYAPNWTNHNPSDPGITLIELFAWLMEMLLYRLDRIPELHLLTFLKLLNGPDWKLESGADLKTAIRDSVLKLRRLDRAVTVADHETLAREASPEVARAKAMLRRNLGASGESERQRDREGHSSMIILPWVFKLSEASLTELRIEGVPETVLTGLKAIKGQQIIGREAFAKKLEGVEQASRFAEAIMRQAYDVEDPSPQPAKELVKTVEDYLDPRRLLTTRQHVVGPVYVPIGADLLITRQTDMPEQSLREQVVQAIRTFLHPLRGGLDGRGWPFGRSVYLSELNRLLESIPGLNYIVDIGLFNQCQPDTLRCAKAPPLWNDEGDLIGLALQDYHLPLAQIDPGRLVIATEFVPVQVRVEVTVGAGVKMTAELRGAIKTVVKRLFHPRYGGPNGKTARIIDRETIRIALLRRPEVGAITTISIESATNQMGDDAVRINERELVDAKVTVTVSTGVNQ